MLGGVRAAPPTTLRSVLRVAALPLALLASGCGEGAETPRAEPVAAPITEPLAPDPLDGADGLEVRRGDDGRISIAATDRTGRPLAITYENASYLESALPTLARSLTGPQIDALRRIAAEERR
jgi:hypothetical protein